MGGAKHRPTDFMTDTNKNIVAIICPKCKDVLTYRIPSSISIAFSCKRCGIAIEPPCNSGGWPICKFTISDLRDAN